MSPRVPKPSKRFIRAATIERDETAAHRRRLDKDRTRLLDEVRRLDEALALLDERLRALNNLVGGPPDKSGGPAEGSSAQESGETDAPGGRRLLSGPAVRAAAVQVLLQQPDYIEAVHYREWYDMLVEAGYAVAGKKPLAVFLTQITRSPVIQKSTEAGIYELDRQAPLRLRQRLERLNTELNDVRRDTTSELSDVGSARARRHELNVAINQTERALEEALRVLRRNDSALVA